MEIYTIKCLPNLLLDITMEPETYEDEFLAHRMAKIYKTRAWLWCHRQEKWKDDLDQLCEEITKTIVVEKYNLNEEK